MHERSLPWSNLLTANTWSIGCFDWEFVLIFPYTRDGYRYMLISTSVPLMHGLISVMFSYCLCGSDVTVWLLLSVIAADGVSDFGCTLANRSEQNTACEGHRDDLLTRDGFGLNSCSCVLVLFLCSCVLVLLCCSCVLLFFCSFCSLCSLLYLWRDLLLGVLPDRCPWTWLC